jgi:hypothetical protein
MTIRPSAIVALNRAIAVARNEGPERGLEEIRLITDGDRLAAYPFLSAAVGELELRRGRHDTAREGPDGRLPTCCPYAQLDRGYGVPARVPVCQSGRHAGSVEAYGCAAKSGGAGGEGRMNGITALEARIEEAEDHEADLKDRARSRAARQIPGDREAMMVDQLTKMLARSPVPSWLRAPWRRRRRQRPRWTSSYP